MLNAMGVPQRVLLLGATSEIGLAIVRRYAERSPLDVVLAGRPGPDRQAAAALLDSLGCRTQQLDFDAAAWGDHPAVVERACARGDIDLAVVAFGVLGDQELAWTDHAAAVHLAEVNYVGAVSVGVLLGEVVRRQGHGTLVALSSVAAQRPRRSNFVYGSSKAGLDAFFTGLGEALREHGGRVLVVRPGFVHSKMTTGLEPAPLAATPDQVAEAIATALVQRREQVWVPAPLRPVMTALRMVPRPLFRRLPL